MEEERTGNPETHNNGWEGQREKKGPNLDENLHSLNGTFKLSLWWLPAGLGTANRWDTSLVRRLALWLRTPKLSLITSYFRNIIATLSSPLRLSSELLTIPQSQKNRPGLSFKMVGSLETQPILGSVYLRAYSAIPLSFTGNNPLINKFAFQNCR